MMSAMKGILEDVDADDHVGGGDDYDNDDYDMEHVSGDDNDDDEEYYDGDDDEFDDDDDDEGDDDVDDDDNDADDDDDDSVLLVAMVLTGKTLLFACSPPQACTWVLRAQRWMGGRRGLRCTWATPPRAAS